MDGPVAEAGRRIATRRMAEAQALAAAGHARRQRTMLTDFVGRLPDPKMIDVDRALDLVGGRGGAEEEVLRESAHPFTAPDVSPEMNSFCNSRNRPSTGAIETTAGAEKYS